MNQAITRLSTWPLYPLLNATRSKCCGICRAPITVAHLTFIMNKLPRERFRKQVQTVRGGGEGFGSIKHRRSWAFCQSVPPKMELRASYNNTKYSFILLFPKLCHSRLFADTYVTPASTKTASFFLPLNGIVQKEKKHQSPESFCTIPKQQFQRFRGRKWAKVVGGISKT